MQATSAQLWLLDACLLPEQMRYSLAARYSLGAMRTRRSSASDAAAGDAGGGDGGGSHCVSPAGRRAQQASCVCAANAAVALEGGDAGGKGRPGACWPRRHQPSRWLEGLRPLEARYSLVSLPQLAP